MRLNTAIVIATVTLLIGVAFSEHHLWIPISVLCAAVVDLFTRSWTASNHVGEWVALSIIVKFVFALIGLYATLGQLACFGVLAWWLFT